MQNSVTDLTQRLLKSLDSNYNVIDMSAVFEIIHALDHVHITEDILKTTRLGKYINELRRRTTNETLAKKAKELLKKWREQVLPHKSKSTGPGGGGATPQPQINHVDQKNNAVLQNHVETKNVIDQNGLTKTETQINNVQLPPHASKYLSVNNIINSKRMTSQRLQAIASPPSSSSPVKFSPTKSPRCSNDSDTSSNKSPGKSPRRKYKRKYNKTSSSPGRKRVKLNGKYSSMGSNTSGMYMDDDIVIINSDSNSSFLKQTDLTTDMRVPPLHSVDNNFQSISSNSNSLKQPNNQPDIITITPVPVNQHNIAAAGPLIQSDPPPGPKKRGRKKGSKNHKTLLAQAEESFSNKLASVPVNSKVKTTQELLASIQNKTLINNLVELGPKISPSTTPPLLINKLITSPAKDYSASRSQSPLIPKKLMNESKMFDESSRHSISSERSEKMDLLTKKEHKQNTVEVIDLIEDDDIKEELVEFDEVGELKQDEDKILQLDEEITPKPPETVEELLSKLPKIDRQALIDDYDNTLPKCTCKLIKNDDGTEITVDINSSDTTQSVQSSSIFDVPVSVLETDDNLEESNRLVTYRIEIDPNCLASFYFKDKYRLYGDRVDPERIERLHRQFLDYINATKCEKIGERNLNLFGDVDVTIATTCLNNEKNILKCVNVTKSSASTNSFETSENLIKNDCGDGSSSLSFKLYSNVVPNYINGDLIRKDLTLESIDYIRTRQLVPYPNVALTLLKTPIDNEEDLKNRHKLLKKYEKWRSTCCMCCVKNYYVSTQNDCRSKAIVENMTSRSKNSSNNNLITPITSIPLVEDTVGHANGDVDSLLLNPNITNLNSYSQPIVSDYPHELENYNISVLVPDIAEMFMRSKERYLASLKKDDSEKDKAVDETKDDKSDTSTVYEEEEGDNDKQCNDVSEIVAEPISLNNDETLKSAQKPLEINDEFEMLDDKNNVKLISNCDNVNNLNSISDVECTCQCHSSDFIETTSNFIDSNNHRSETFVSDSVAYYSTTTTNATDTTMFNDNKFSDTNLLSSNCNDHQSFSSDENASDLKLMPSSDANSTTGMLPPVLSADACTLNENQIKSIQNNFDTFREYHEVVSLRSYDDELLHILPYVVLD